MHQLVGPKFIALVSALVILPFVRSYPAELTHALDLFGSKSPTEQEITGTAGNPSLSELPDFATVAETTMPAVVNISTTPKARTAGQRPGAPNPRRSPFGGNDPLEEFFRRFFGDRPPPNQPRTILHRRAEGCVQLRGRISAELLAEGLWKDSVFPTCLRPFEV